MSINTYQLLSLAVLAVVRSFVLLHPLISLVPASHIQVRAGLDLRADRRDGVRRWLRLFSLKYESGVLYEWVNWGTCTSTFPIWLITFYISYQTLRKKV